MIEINLTDSPAYIVGNYSSGTAKKSAGILLIVAMLVIIPLVSVFLVRAFFEIHEEKEFAAVEAAVAVRTKSRAANERIVEDIIDSVRGFGAVPITDKRYEDMTRFEQLDYEVKFTAMALSEFAKIIPSGITFREIRISNYRTLVAEGTAPDRQAVLRLLSNIRAGDWELLPRPQTTISDGGTFYSFRIEAFFYPSISNLLKNPINPANIPDIRHLERVKGRVVAAARNAKLKTAGLSLVNSINEPHKREFRYSIKLDGNFTNILNFVAALSQMPEPVRIENLHLRYRQRSVEATAIVVIGVR